MSNFLDKTGLSYFWEKVKSWSNNRFYKKTGGDLDGDITFVKKEGQVARSIGFGNTGADGAHLTFSGNAIQFSGPEGSFLAMSGKKIELLGDASKDTDAVTYKQLKERTPSSPGNSQVGWVATVIEDGAGGVKPEWKEFPKELPEDGAAGQVLKKTETGTEWGDVDGGLTQEEADARYLQLTGGTIDGTLQIGTGESKDSIPGAINLTMFNPNIRPTGPYISSIKIVDGVIPVEEGSMVGGGGYFGIRFSDAVRISGTRNGCSLIVSGTINGVKDPVYSIDAANKRYVDSKSPKSTTVTLAASGWVNSNAIFPGDPVPTGSPTQTVTVQGILADETKQLIQPMPAVASQAAYMSAGIYCSGQAANSLTFTCTTVPTEDISLFVVITEVGA